MKATTTAFVTPDGEKLPRDLDGDPYRTDDVLGAQKVTSCCGAFATYSDLDLVCRACYSPTCVDGPARLAVPFAVPLAEQDL